MFLCLFLACVGLLAKALCVFLAPVEVSLVFLLYGLALALAVALAFLELEAEGAFFLYGGMFAGVVSWVVCCESVAFSVMDNSCLVRVCLSW